MACDRSAQTIAAACAACACGGGAPLPQMQTELRQQQQAPPQQTPQPQQQMHRAAQLGMRYAALAEGVISSLAGMGGAPSV